jgi:signal transduction histidine kinase
MGFCELLLDESYSIDDKAVFAKNLTKNGDDLLKLINDIMDISKIQERQFEITKKKFNLNNLLSIIYNEFEESEVRQTRKHVSFNLIKGSPNSEIEIYSDPVRLMLIFQNLLNNAFFFTPEGFVHFGYKNTDSGIELFVHDSGCGIDDSNKPLIFKPFFKGKNVVVGNKGFGLGLAISKGLSKLLDSDLQYTSIVGKGSKFYLAIDKKHITDISLSTHKSTEPGLKIKSIYLDSPENKHLQN